MPRLPSIKPQQIIKFLERYGFTHDHTSGSHFIFYHPLTKHRAVVPRHNRDLPKGTLLSLLHEAGLSREDILGFFRKRG